MIDFPHRFAFSAPTGVDKQKQLAEEIFRWLKENVTDGNFNISGTYLSFRVSLYSKEDALAFKLRFGKIEHD